MGDSPQKTHALIHKHICDILDLLHDGIYITDREGNTLMVNEPYQHLTGISASQVMGKNVVELMNTGVFSVIVNPDVVATGQSVTLVQEVNGRKVVLHGQPVTDDDGRVEMVVTFVRDITVFSRLKDEISEQRSLVDYYQRQVSNIDPEEVFMDDGMVAVSRHTKNMLTVIDNLSPTDATVLIMGETGVGKDLVAQRIHNRSLRAGQPYLKVDCSAIPESLVESELFGYAPGAFSGASSKGKQGFFKQADNGTLFLDEVGELSLSMQTKLLRAIHDQEIIRVGSTDVTKVNVRIIAATNRNLEDEVSRGSFRDDLFYRLKVAVITIPALRERKDDILPLIQVFIKRFNKKYAKHVALSNNSERALLDYDWPGNVRELENMIHGLVVNATKSRISCNDLPSGVSSNPSCASISSDFSSYDIGNAPLKEIVANIEKDLISQVLKVYGSVAKAAEVLQVDRSTIFRKTRGGKLSKRRKQRSKKE